MSDNTLNGESAIQDRETEVIQKELGSPEQRLAHYLEGRDDVRSYVDHDIYGNKSALVAAKMLGASVPVCNGQNNRGWILIRCLYNVNCVLIGLS